MPCQMVENNGSLSLSSCSPTPPVSCQNPGDLDFTATQTFWNPLEGLSGTCTCTELPGMDRAGGALADWVSGCAGVWQVWVTWHPVYGESGAPMGFRSMGILRAPAVQNTCLWPLHRANQGNVTGGTIRHLHGLRDDLRHPYLLCMDNSNETTHVPSAAGEG